MANENEPKFSKASASPANNQEEETVGKPKGVEKSNDKKIDEDFPGYPHYPAKDDILNPENHIERVDVDVEKLTRSSVVSSGYLKDIEGASEVKHDAENAEEDEEPAQPSEADVTAEDLLILGPRDADMDMDEDEELRLRGWTPKDPADLDIPDAEAEGNKGAFEQDEENSYYSLGGDDKMNLEENDDENNF